MSKATVFTAMLALSASTLTAAESIFFGSSEINLEAHASTPTDPACCACTRSAGPLTRAVLTLDRSLEGAFQPQTAHGVRAGNASETRLTVKNAAQAQNPASSTNDSVAYQQSLQDMTNFGAKLSTSVCADRANPPKARSGVSSWRALIGNPADRTASPSIRD